MAKSSFKHIRVSGITAVVDTMELLQSALFAGVDWVVFGGESYHHDAIIPMQYEKAVYMAHQAGAKIAFNTPRIIRNHELQGFHTWLRRS